jgi:hypothetical protein
VAVLLHYFMTQQLASADQSLASVEFGNEFSGGAGSTWLKKFAVEVSA